MHTESALGRSKQVAETHAKDLLRRKAEREGKEIHGIVSVRFRRIRHGDYEGWYEATASADFRDKPKRNQQSRRRWRR